MKNLIYNIKNIQYFEKFNTVDLKQIIVEYMSNFKNFDADNVFLSVFISFINEHAFGLERKIDNKMSIDDIGDNYIFIKQPYIDYDGNKRIGSYLLAYEYNDLKNTKEYYLNGKRYDYESNKYITNNEIIHRLFAISNSNVSFNGEFRPSDLVLFLNYQYNTRTLGYGV